MRCCSALGGKLRHAGSSASQLPLPRLQEINTGRLVGGWLCGCVCVFAGAETANSHSLHLVFAIAQRK